MPNGHHSPLWWFHATQWDFLEQYTYSDGLCGITNIHSVGRAMSWCQEKEGVSALVMERERERERESGLYLNVFIYM